MNTLVIGPKIKYFRKRAGVTQLELELRINASFGSISRMENGITNPTKETLWEISNALQLSWVDTAYLFGITVPGTNFNFDLLLN